jgi:hypothetical protein
MKVFFITAVSIFLLTFNLKAQTFEKTVYLETPKSGESLYKYIPFEVPLNVESLSFSFEYDKKGGTNRLEFGVFDSRFSGRNEDKNGFRGWSGSVRDAAFIAFDKATHGYAAGKIPAGKWFFIIGLAKIAPTGVELKLKVRFNEIDEKPRRQFEEENAKKFTHDKFEREKPETVNGFTWFRGDLHAHTFHGDGSWSVKAILDSAESNGLDFVALTEHNTFTHHLEIEAERKNYPNLLIIRGEEVTTYGGHIGIWGLPFEKWVDFRVLPNLETSGKQIADEAHRFGALASINHPTMNCGGCGWTFGAGWQNADSVEIWNAMWDADDEKALEIWDSFLRQGRTITAVGSSDSHQPPYEPSTYPTNLRIGEPCVFVGAKSLTQKDLFEAIRNGRVFVAENPRYSIKFTANRTNSVGDQIRILKNRKINLNFSLEGFALGSKVLLIVGGKVIKESLISSGIFSDKFRFEPVETTYARLEIRNQSGKMLAFTNPIYFRAR